LITIDEPPTTLRVMNSIYNYSVDTNGYNTSMIRATIIEVSGISVEFCSAGKIVFGKLKKVERKEPIFRTRGLHRKGMQEYKGCYLGRWSSLG